jgi:hypothetical protein
LSAVDVLPFTVTNTSSVLNSGYGLGKIISAVKFLIFASNSLGTISQYNWFSHLFA